MKKILLFVVAALFCGNAMAQKLTGTASISEGVGELVISIESEQLAAIAQVTLQFPENLSIKKNTKGRYVFELGELCTEDHTATVQDKTDGVLVLVKNEYGDPFEAASGVLITLPLEASGDIAANAEINMTGIVLGTNDTPSKKLNTEAEGTISLITTGINGINAAENEGAAYNLAGQKVDKNYKGIIVKNGKKVLE